MDADKKKKILENEGYDFDSELLCFVNREAGKIFSSAWIDVQNLNTVQISLSLPHNPTIWKLFFNPDQPHEEMRTVLFEKYGKTP
ncbi:MAG: hypothetical protein AMJ61_07610 [Desulfobacterales bacterium SG8_35_2]|jgi:hypothetical protein|nr:MAG: hypothetical protein AMJ61_07610 [Desulfobacterales bacterium SG8_35_2]